MGPEPSFARNQQVPAPPDPGQARSLDDLADRLRLLKAWAGNPSYGSITARVNAAWTETGRPPAELPGKTTVVDCFRPGRRRVNADLVVAVVQALLPDIGYTSQWRQALAMIGGQAEAAGQVRVQDELPPALPTFTGRPGELDQLGRAAQRGGAVCVITGMAGVGKTQLAVRAAQRAIQVSKTPIDQVLFVNLRGFDRTGPPADPAAVLEGFLRLLGVPAHLIPPDRSGRSRAFRARLATIRSVIVLDNAADAEQVAPLLPEPGASVRSAGPGHQPAGAAGSAGRAESGAGGIRPGRGPGLPDCGDARGGTG